LRNEIEMRVIGLGWLQFETRWSSSSDESVGTVEYLLLLLKDILGGAVPPDKEALSDSSPRCHRSLP